VIPCRKWNDESRWTCCTDGTKPCRANLYGPQAKWRYDSTRESFVPYQTCTNGTKPDAYCCRASPWPEGINFGYPFRYHPEGSYRPHFAMMWPYGGLGYVLSRGLLDAIPRETWQMCMYGLQCANADHRVTTCVLNAGFSITKVGDGIPGIKHHITIPRNFHNTDDHRTSTIKDVVAPAATRRHNNHPPLQSIKE